MILADVVTRTAGGREALLELIRAELTEPLGITTLVVEFDASGNFLGGGFVWASARDWARLGLLFLRDGLWDGRRILPEGFVDFARTPAPAPNNGTFGAHLWLNREPREGQFKLMPGLPDSIFAMTGNSGQYVVVAPDRDLVVVRLGEMQAIDWSALGSAVGGVVAAFPLFAEARP